MEKFAQTTVTMIFLEMSAMKLQKLWIWVRLRRWHRLIQIIQTDVSKCKLRSPERQQFSGILERKEWNILWPHQSVSIPTESRPRQSDQTVSYLRTQIMCHRAKIRDKIWNCKDVLKTFIIGCKSHGDCPGASYCFDGRCEMGKLKEITLYGVVPV